MKFRKYLVESKNVSLLPFDKEVFNAIDGKKHMFLPYYLEKKEGTFYTISNNDNKIGIVGFVHTEETPFLIVGIIKEFRGQGFLIKAYEALIKKHDFKKVYADVEKSNKTSIDAHKDIGFKPVPEGEEVDKRLYSTDIRLYKEF